MYPDSITPIGRALLSVSDKTNLTKFAQGLADLGVELLSTGGTGKHLKSEGLKIIDVSDFTGFPEMFDEGKKEKAVGLLCQPGDCRER